MPTGASQIFVEQVREAAAILGLGGGGGGEFIHVREQQSSGVQSGTFNNTLDRVRTLNVIPVNDVAGASLSANRLTLPAGTYNIVARAPAFRVDRHKAQWFNFSDSTFELIGSAEFAGNTDNGGTNSWVIGQFTIAAAKTFELRHRAQTTVVTNGFGVESTFQVPANQDEVYAEVWLEKVA